MNWWEPHNFEQRREHLKTRQTIIKGVRSYFDGQGFDEVQTPVLQIMPSPDTHIHAFETTKLGHSLKPIQALGLHTSPEIAMKKLLVAGMEKIYQICPVFRNAEEGPLHSPEFTMLEWYRTGTDYTAMMKDCEALIQSLGMFEEQEFERLSVEDAFKKYANIDLPLPSSFGLTEGSHANQREPAIKSQDAALEKFKDLAQSIGIRTIETDTFEDVFHAVMAEKIEPFLGHGAPTILYDYPISMAALARKAKDERFAERFELYISGVEIANAFSELTAPIEQRTRLEVDLKAKKELYGIDASIDEDFIAALEHGMPESSGCALGLDRLIMIACDVDDIAEVLWT